MVGAGEYEPDIPKLKKAAQALLSKMGLVGKSIKDDDIQEAYVILLRVLTCSDLL